MLLLTLLMGILCALAADGDDDVHALRITPPAAPTEVSVGVYLVGLTAVSSPSVSFPTFEAEVLLDTAWIDPRLAFDAEGAGRQVEVFQEPNASAFLSRIWRPELAVENEEGSPQIEHREVELHSDGLVEVKERFSVVAHAEVDLRRFPFDEQHFDLLLASFPWHAGQVVLRVDEGHTGFDPAHHNLEWVVSAVDGTVTEEPRVRLSEPVSALRVRIDASRLSGFYLYKLLIPLIFIVVFTWSAFWMTAEATGGRMQRTFVALLTVVAFHHIVSTHLPRIAYLTFVDAVVYSCFASVGATLVTLIVIHNAEHRGDVDRARKVERHARWIQPLGFVGLLVALWVVYHL